ncbi:MAG: hypothetical protein AAGA54_07505 [Myxococcota bacterium]
MIAAALLVLATATDLAAPAHRMDAPMPAQPPIDDLRALPRAHALGTNTTLYVNFDGVELSECNPSDAKRN